jgi:hypothetical protein
LFRRRRLLERPLHLGVFLYFFDFFVEFFRHGLT